MAFNIPGVGSSFRSLRERSIRQQERPSISFTKQLIRKDPMFNQLTTAQPPLRRDPQEFPQGPQSCQSILCIDFSRQSLRCDRGCLVYKEGDEWWEVVEVDGPCS